MTSIATKALETMKSNFDGAERILKELRSLSASYEIAKAEEKIMIERSIKALIDQIELINEPIEALIQSISVDTAEIKTSKIKIKKRARKYERITTVTLVKPIYITKKNKERFLKYLGIEKKALKKVRSKIIKAKLPKSEEIMMKPSAFASFSNRIFYGLSSQLTKKALFKNMRKDLRKANMPHILSSYISIILFITCLTFFVSFLIALAFTFMYPITIITIIRNLGIVIALTAIIFFLALSWPANMAASGRKKLESELPFATSHMAAIASSKIEPSRIFSIMALAKEYKAFNIEMRKIINQINVYGYNLTAALRNVAKQTPSRKFADLLNGISTTITTGGNLTLYLNEKAKSSLLDYRLRHERYSTVIGMYSDIYTALLIAAPLIFMLLLAIISIIGTTFIGMPAPTLASLGIGIIIALNILFLIFLHITQPEI